MKNIDCGKVLCNNKVTNEVIRYKMEINLKNCYASIRYLPTVSSYVVRGYAKSMEKIMDMKVSEVDLLKMLDHKPITETNLDNDTFSDLKFIIKRYFLTEVTLLNARKQYHRRKLNRCLTSVLYLNLREHSHPRVYERTQNIENYEAIYENCLKKDRFEEFIELNKEWCRYNHVRFIKADWVKKYRQGRVIK